MVVGPAAQRGWPPDPAGIGVGRGLAGAGAVAMIVLQNKIIADWFTGRPFMWAISVSVAAYPIGVGLAQLVLPPLARRSAGRRRSCPTRCPWRWRWCCSWRASDRRRTPRRRRRRFSLPGGRECLLLVIAGLIWTAYTAGYSGYTGYVPSLMAARGEGLVLTGLVLTIATWGNVPATMLGAGLAARFGGLRIFLLGTAALVVGMAGAALLDWPVTCAVVVGIVGSFHPGVIMAVGTLSARPENRAVGMGLFYSIYYAGNAVVPALCGWAADLIGRAPRVRCWRRRPSRRWRCRCICCTGGWRRMRSCWRGREPDGHGLLRIGGSEANDKEERNADEGTDARQARRWSGATHRSLAKRLLSMRGPPMRAVLSPAARSSCANAFL